MEIPKNNQEEYLKYDLEERKKEERFGKNYKWIALANTTLGVLMATIDSSILIISLPAIFNGLGINPLMPGNITLLIWLLLGYMIMSSVVVVTIGRLSDMFGRVKLYNLGFAIFAAGSTMLYIISYSFTGVLAVMLLIIFRLVQGFGGGFLFANGSAIITDAFPKNQRGTALGLNMVAVTVGSLLGLILGGVLSAIDWHLIFLISVPVGILGAFWAYWNLHEIAIIKKDQKIDYIGNILFAGALLSILISLTYGLLPYGNSSMGWSNPFVISGIVLGFILMVLFIFVETKVKDPMFHLDLFKIRAFTAGNLSMFLAGISRGGLQFMLIIWLQGIWLPLHGVDFINTPLQAGIDLIPLLLGFLIMGPIAGKLSDKYGPRFLATTGMMLNVIGFFAIFMLPVNFDFVIFAIITFVMGLGQGMFSAPNTSYVMSSVPPEHRGASAGMRATLMNMSFMFSIIIFFSVLAIGLNTALPAALYKGLINQNVPVNIANQISQLPPTSALFAALLGYNPMKALIPASILSTIPKANSSVIVGDEFFPNLISQPFSDGLKTVLIVGIIMAFIAALASAIKEKKE